jgi:nicotinamide phosphoribosyltransferase
MAGFSIPAAEHSTITSWGREGEVDAFRNMLTQYPKGLVAVVSDSFDIIKACTDLWGTELVELVKNREGCLVRRARQPVHFCGAQQAAAQPCSTPDAITA